MRKATEGFFESWDGTRLFYRAWTPETPSARSPRAILLMHRGHEHSGRVQDIVDGLNLPNYYAFCYDARGHGKSPGPRGYAKDFGDLVKDVEAFSAFIRSEHGVENENIAIVANSVGAVVASTWVHDFAPRVRSMVLAAPALRIKLYVPGALPSLRMLNKIKHPAFISSYVKSKMLTHDQVEADRYTRDPLITRDIAVNILLGLHDASTRLIEDSGAITTPTLVLSAGKDFVVKLGPQQRFFDGIRSNLKKMHVFPKFYHGVFYEKDKSAPLAMARAFIEQSFEKPVERLPLLESHHKGYTFDQYQQLLKPAGFFKEIGFAFQRIILGTIGRLSQGIRVGHRYGFDSGLSLDYVYENQPRGLSPIGKFIDHGYINAVGWRGIRMRKTNLENAIESAIRHLVKNGEPVRVLDLAGGPGRYLLDVASRYLGENIAIEVRDYNEANIAAGKKLASKMGITNVRYRLADAFSPVMDPGPNRPNIIVISGFFELYSDNSQIKKAIENALAHATPDCFLVYTGQPWHPQRETIARTLTNREGQAWIMRLRTQAEIDEIFRSHGFDKIGMQIDPMGIFTVSLAKRTQATVAQVTTTSLGAHEAFPAASSFQTPTIQ